MTRELYPLTEAKVIELYQDADAWWTFDYDGDPKAPHAELTGGRHSDGYIDSGKVLCDPSVSDLLAWNLAHTLRQRNAILPVPWVVSSPYAAITFGHDLARHIGARFGFAEKDPTDPAGKALVWSGRFAIQAGAFALQCEELITTLGTALKVRDAIERQNPHPVSFLPDVATIIYRPEQLQGGLIDITALVRRIVKSWKADECPLCRQGSRPLRPKSHWAELVGK